MLERALQKRVTIEQFMANKDCEFNLAEHDWQLLKDTHTFLKPFHDVTKKAEGDSTTLDAVLFLMDFL